MCEDCKTIGLQSCRKGKSSEDIRLSVNHSAFFTRFKEKKQTRQTESAKPNANTTSAAERTRLNAPDKGNLNRGSHTCRG